MKIKIDLPSFQLELTSNDPLSTLPELRKVLESIHLDDQVIYEEFMTQEIGAIFSDTFVSNEKLMKLVKKLLKMEEEYKFHKMVLPITATIDLEQKTKNIGVDSRELNKGMLNLSSTVPGNLVKHGIVHVGGELPENEKLRIIDHIHTQMPTANIRAFHTSEGEESALVECIFFGDFPDDSE